MIVDPHAAVDRSISARGLRKAFGPNLVLDGIDLDVRRGEAVALLGANGAGKTTLLRIAATLVRPTRGEIRVGGADCAREPEAARRQLGFLGHGSWLYEDLTALENLKFWATLGGRPASAAALRAALAVVELDRWADERVRPFSAGMKRRLSIARLLIAHPSVLLLDEPFTGLDQRGAKWLEEHLQAFKGAGGAVLMSTHSFGRGFGVADRAAILAGGRIAADVAVAPLGAEGVRRLYEVTVEEGA
ncbi:MAG TPA: heme ABC exporter ATP-binding protein CcmA [Candidatus Acidoferrum sp.]|nr:heme ABC exporter ATP-binding protein CcmA [Candidatus Acidoferrum sp.]